MIDKELQKRKHVVSVCFAYVKKLLWSKKRLAKLFPLTKRKITSLTEEQDNDIESFLSRFSKLQDFAGAKLFPMLLYVFAPSQLEKLTFIDQLNLLEKLNLIPSRQDWEALRKIRNKLAHEYPEERSLHMDELNEAYSAIDKLFSFFEFVKKQLPKELLTE